MGLSCDPEPEVLMHCIQLVQDALKLREKKHLWLYEAPQGLQKRTD